ncbi:MAG TPA: LytR C-terminal domain-containing protein [Acetivibrio sp.]|uniref:LytR C-terminal domain-containing protein n=1 Tax=Acetivibrio sp. TaxID=1872092 RepID=UPI002C01D5AB|nr:LytR C-terminal domain-containing protein [Acetivibrio sp.]HOM02955.1 LytR C-terminal domain-containing protein [Acetivibrio sp.]
MAKKKLRRKKRNRGFGLFGMMLVLLLIAGGYFYFQRNAEDSSNNFHTLMAKILKTEPTSAISSTPTPTPTLTNTLAISPSTEPVDTLPEELSTNNPRETQVALETSVVIQQTGASIQVINYTGRKKLSEEVRTTLENYGFVVSSGNGSSLKYVSSAIIEKKENVSGEELKSLLNIKRIKKEVDPGSRFDFIIILGDDYEP